MSSPYFDTVTIGCMTTRKSGSDLSMLMYVPLQPTWLIRLPAFQSGDARIVRACINLLCAAFHSVPAGQLPKTIEAIATAAQLPLDVTRENYAVLTAGWKETKDSLAFEPMVALAERLDTGYGDALRQLQDSTVVAISAPDLFNSELLPAQGQQLAALVGPATREKATGPLADTKVKRRLPENAPLTPELVHILQDRGFAANSHAEIWQNFVDRQRSQQTTSASWVSEFRRWLTNQIRYNHLVPDAPSLPAAVVGGANSSAPLSRTPSPGPSAPFSFGRPPARGSSAHLANNQREVLDTNVERMANAREAVAQMRDRQRGG